MLESVLPWRSYAGGIHISAREHGCTSSGVPCCPIGPQLTGGPTRSLPWIEMVARELYLTVAELLHESRRTILYHSRRGFSRTAAPKWSSFNVADEIGLEQRLYGYYSHAGTDASLRDQLYGEPQEIRRRIWGRPYLPRSAYWRLP